MNIKRIFFLTVLFLIAGLISLNFKSGITTEVQKTISVVKESQAAVPEETVVNDAGQNKFNLTMLKHKNQDETTTYSFHVINLETKVDFSLYEEQVGMGTSFETPFNSWSPDDKQLFIQRNSGGESNYYVFNADGSSFKDGQKFLNVKDYWSEKNKFRIKTITGWAAKDLLVVKTLTDDGRDGPSYWFVISSRKFMQLAH